MYLPDDTCVEEEWTRHARPMILITTSTLCVRDGTSMLMARPANVSPSSQGKTAKRPRQEEMIGASVLLHELIRCGIGRPGRRGGVPTYQMDEIQAKQSRDDPWSKL